MTRPIVHLIAHTHWDREWYLPLGGFRARLVGMVEALLRQLEADPRIESFLLDGQIILLEDFLSVCPDLAPAVSALVQAGRLQVGPWYVLADEQIPAGESLIRNLLVGGAAARRLVGSAVDESGRRQILPVLYSPDAFGHPACLPTLGQEFGIRYAVVWRGIGRQETGDRDLFWWESPDGARVLVYHLPPEGYEIGATLTRAGEQLGEAWRRVGRSVLPRRATRQVAVFVGADHHAASPDLGDLAGRLAAIAPDCEFRSSRLDEFFAAALSEARDLVLVRGELRETSGYTWALQGTHGTRAQLKRRNSRLELLLTRIAEPLSALRGGGTERAVLRQAWREVVQCHFHDAICGTVDDAVARAVAVRFDDASAAAMEIVRGLLHRVAGHDPDLAREGESRGGRLLVWNPVARSRGGVVVVELTFFRRDVLVGPPGTRSARQGPGAHPFLLLSLGGEFASELVPQVLEVKRSVERVDATYHYPDQDEVDRVTVAIALAESLPGFGGRLFDARDGIRKPLEPFAAASGRLLWNGRVQLGLADDGTTVLRAAGGGRPFTGLLALESERDVGDLYTFCPVPRDSLRRPSRPSAPRVMAAGPLVAGLEWGLSMRCGGGAGTAMGRVAARFRVEAIGDSPALRCRIALDNHATDHRLRLRLPTGLRESPILAGTQFGVVQRPPRGETRGRPVGVVEAPVPTAVAHRFVAMAKGDRGLALFAPGFFEYEWTPQGDLLITLLRAVGELSRADLRTRPGHAGWPTPTPAAQCLGREVIELGLAPVTAQDLAAPERLVQLWEDRFLPPVGHWIRDFAPAEHTPSGDPSCILEGEGLVLSALKPADDGNGLIVRCVNLRGAGSRGCLRLGRRVALAVETRADESPIGGLDLEESGRVVTFGVTAYGMITVRIQWAD